MSDTVSSLSSCAKAHQEERGRDWRRGLAAPQQPQEKTAAEINVKAKIDVECPLRVLINYKRKKQ